MLFIQLAKPHHFLLKCLYQARKVSSHVLKCLYQARKVSSHVLKCLYQAPHLRSDDTKWDQFETKFVNSNVCDQLAPSQSVLQTQYQDYKIEVKVDFSTILSYAVDSAFCLLGFLLLFQVVLFSDFLITQKNIKTSPLGNHIFSHFDETYTDVL